MTLILLIVLSLCVLVLLWRPSPTSEPFRTIATILIVLVIFTALFAASGHADCANSHSLWCK